MVDTVQQLCEKFVVDTLKQLLFLKCKSCGYYSETVDIDTVKDL